MIGLGLDVAVDPLPDKRFHILWLERFAQRQPADLGVLAQGFDRGSSARCKERLDLLRDLPPDPRLTPALVHWGRVTTEHGPAWNKVWTAWLKLLVHTGDPRLHDGLAQVLARLAQTARYNHGLVEPVEALIRRIERAQAKIPTGHTAVDVVSLDRVLEDWLDRPLTAAEVYPPRRGTAMELRERVDADPDDDGIVAVWADAMSEEANPLGLFVNLQLAAEHRALTVRERTSLRRTEPASLEPLIGPLGPVVDAPTAVFRRGLLYAARVRFPESRFTELVDHGRWASVRQMQTTIPFLHRFPRVLRMGLRLVPTPLATAADLPGLLYRPLPAPRWEQLRALAGLRSPLGLQAVCVRLPQASPSVSDASILGDLDALPALFELHLVDSRPGDAAPQPLALGALGSHPRLRSMPRLVLDDFEFTEDALTLWNRYRDETAVELILLQPALRIRIYRDAAGLHATCAGAVHLIADRLGPRSGFASIAGPERV